MPGLALFLALLLACLRDAREARRLRLGDPGDRELPLLAEGLQMSLIAFAVAAFFQPIAYQFYFFLIGGLAVAARRISVAEPERAS